MRAWPVRCFAGSIGFACHCAAVTVLLLPAFSGCVCGPAPGLEEHRCGPRASCPLGTTCIDGFCVVLLDSGRPASDAGPDSGSTVDSGLPADSGPASDSGIVVPDGGSPCDPPWWNPAYLHRRRLTVAESASGPLPAGYSVVLEDLDTQACVSAGSMRGDGHDLRLVRWNGGSWAELDRRLVDMNTGQTDIWFKTQSTITVSDASYFIYYGNPVAASAPAHWADSMGADAIPSAVYLAGDDFEEETVGASPDGWEGSSMYAVDLDGSNRVIAVNGSEFDGKFIFAGDLGWTDVVVQMRMRIIETGSTHYGLFARSEGTADFDSVYFGLSDNSTLDFWYCLCPFPSAPSLTSCDFVTDWPVAPAGTSWHALEIRFLGQNADFYYDGSLLGAETMEAGRVTHGRIGLVGGYGSSHGMWDDVVVRKYVDPEPVVSAGAEEPPCS